jgi:hypothetical protein
METSISDKVRAFAREKYVIPQLESGKRQFSIRVKEVFKDLKKEGFPVARRTPLICKALTGPKFLNENGLVKERVDGPPSETSPTVEIWYRVAVTKPTPAVSSVHGNMELTNDGETPEAKALRLTEKLRGLLKEELAEYGGGEAFLRWVRGYDEEDAA